MNCKKVLLYEYLSGGLDPEEAEKTALHLEECRACRERFRIMVALDNPPAPAAARTRGLFPGKKLLLAAAGLLFAVIIPLVYIQLPSLDERSAGADLATRKPYPLVSLETRNSSGQGLGEGLRLYGDGHYREALAVLERREADADALFFSAICHYMLDEPAKAAEKLGRVAGISQKWAPAADWYRAQSLLKLGNTGEAISLLKKISASASSYKTDALGQLEKLEKQ